MAKYLPEMVIFGNEMHVYQNPSFLGYVCQFLGVYILYILACPPSQ